MWIFDPVKVPIAIFEKVQENESMTYMENVEVEEKILRKYFVI